MEDEIQLWGSNRGTDKKCMEDQSDEPSSFKAWDEPEEAEDQLVFASVGFIRKV